MPTISQLAPATAASDSDELLVSQAGTTRKVTRSQILAGVQPLITAAAGTLLGRSSKTVGVPEVVAIGENLVMSGGTLSATAVPCQVSAQLPGVVPSSGDLVGLGQAGQNTSVTYRQFLNGLSSVPNIDVSATVITPTGSETASRLADFAGNTMSRHGGSMTGALGLHGDPMDPGHAATKSYVDTQFANSVSKAGGTLSGALTLLAAPTLGLHATTKNYVDAIAASAVSMLGGTMVGSLTLGADPSLPMQASTKQYADTRVLRSGDTMTGTLTLAADPTAVSHATTKRYVDTQVATAVPRAGGTLSGALVLSGDPTTALQPATKQYADARVARAGDTLTGALLLSGDPSSALMAATKQYVDVKVSRTGDTLSGPLLLSGSPTGPDHAASKSYVDAAVGGTLPKGGGTITGILTLSGDPSADLHASTKRYVDLRGALSLPLSGGTLTGQLALIGPPVLGQHAVSKQYVDGQVLTTLALTGGTVAGPLSLSAEPTSPLHAVTKQYVDTNPGRDGVINVKLPPYSATLNGVTDDTAAFKAAYQAAPVGGTIYVPSGVVNMQSPGAWGVPLTKRVKWVVDGTTMVDGTPLGDAIPTGAPVTVSLPGVVAGHSGKGVSISQSKSQASDFSAWHVSYLVNHDGGASSVICNSRTDTIIYNSPANFVWSGLDRLIWAGVRSPAGAPLAQHVGRYVQSIRQGYATGTDSLPLPQPELWAAVLEYRDHTGKPSSWTAAGLVVEMDWYGNGADDAGNRTIQALVIGQHDTSGAPVELANVIGVSLAPGHTGQVQKVLNVGLPFARSVIDTTNAKQLTGAAAIRLAAGHSIAFEASGSSRLAYDSTTATLRWYQGVLSFAIGKGISVGWQNVATGNTTLSAYLAGNIVFLAGSGAYTVTLPAANAVAAGVGFTFSAVGNVTATIAPASGDSIELSPIMLRQYDRYHIVSDGILSWREVFRTNSVSPRFSGPPVLPSYLVANLPMSVAAGAKAFASNGRKPAEVASAGSGVEVFFDGIRWISVCSGSQILA